MEQRTGEAPIDLIIGCTGCGKGAVGRAVAGKINAEIISVDSMKVYRRMDIGTAKPTAEQRQAVPHHLVDVVEPSASFSVAEFVEHADRAAAEIRGRGRRALGVGGTALYLKSLIHGLFEGPPAHPEIRQRIRERAARAGNAVMHEELRAVDPEAADRIHPNDLRRIERALEVFELTGRPISSFQTQWEAARPQRACRVFGLRRSREDQSRRINERVRRMFAAGLVDEVAALLAEPAPMSEQARQAVGYAETIEHLEGACSLEDAIEAVKINTRHLAKQQRTWFRRFADVHWIDASPDEPTDSLVTRLLAAMNAPPSAAT